jgi:predicted ATPase/class 3 adenylate cyclase
MPDLPTGTVTFLLTDIERSTRLWEQHPEAMPAALARHDALITEIVQQHGGAVVKSRGEGDSLFAVFARAVDAVVAAGALQHVLHAEPWPEGVALRVRVAVHTGDAEVREGDYYGAAVNRCARLRAIASGGQTLLSLATQELVRDHLPAGATLRDLGEHRLRDLVRPERVFQLDVPGVPTQFAPLRSLEAFPTNLPVQLTSFIGRERELAEVKQLLEHHRLVTFTGAGGTGKSRLSLQVAADLLDAYPDGVWLVELAPLTDPRLVPGAVADVLGLREEAGRPLLSTLTDVLRKKALLLILDNCEHVISACAELAEALLRQSTQLRILASSREALGIAGEHPFRVPSLSLPDPRRLSSAAPDLATALSQSEAVRLFIDRAVTIQPHFHVTNRNAPAVAQICHRLDGIPLAIELAAARVKVLPVEQIASRLDDRFRLLTGGSRTALPRQQTLRALIDWSYDLLSEAERTLLRQLSVFAGGWTLEAAEAVCAGGGVDEDDVLELLTRLVDKSLVLPEDHDGEVRYRLPETVRQYARDRLLEAAEAAALGERHLAYCLAFSERAEAELWGSNQFAWLERLEQEHDNLRAALKQSLVESERTAESALRLAGAVWLFWVWRGHFREGREWLERALATSRGASVRARAKALLGAGWLAGEQSDYARATALLEESLALSRAAGEPWATAHALGGLGLVALNQGRYERATALHTESLELCRAMGGQMQIAAALYWLGDGALHQGHDAKAQGLYEESLALLRPLGATLRTSRVLFRLGRVVYRQGDPARAEALLEESLALNRDVRDQRGSAYALLSLGQVVHARGDTERAAVLGRETLRLGRDLGERRIVAQALELLAQVGHARGDDRRAARLLGAAEALRDSIGAPVPPADRPEYDQTLAAVRRELDETAFRAAWAQGRAMSLEEAMAEAQPVLAAGLASAP